MTAKNEDAMYDPKVARHKYERLRVNALDHINRTPEFTLFLYNGMSAWLRAFGEQSCTRQESSAVFVKLDMDIPEAGLTSILTDAILNAVGTAGHCRSTT